MVPKTSSFCLVLLLLCVAGFTSAQNIEFPDSQLKTALVNGFFTDSFGDLPIDANGDGEITMAEAQVIGGYIDISDRGISDLTGLHHFVNVTSLQASDNNISDFQPLASLTRLSGLAAWNNPVTNVSPLASLVELGYLDISRSLIDDFDALVTLRKLNDFYVSDSPIRHLPPTMAADMAKLRILSMSSPFLDDISPLSGLPALSNLAVSWSPIRDISVTLTLPALTNLNISHTRVTSLAPLEGRNLNSLAVSGLALDSESIDWLKAQTSFESLEMGSAGISDISFISNMINLEYIDFDSNAIADISALAGLGKLSFLSLGSNLIDDIAPLQGLSQLNNVNLGQNFVSDIKALVNNTSDQLEIIYLDYNNLTDANCEDISELASRATMHFSYEKQNTGTLMCDELGGSIQVNGLLTPPNYLTPQDVWVNQSGKISVSLRHPNADGWDRSGEMDLQYAVTLVSDNEPLTAEIIISDEDVFPNIVVFDVLPEGDYQIRVKRVVDGPGYSGSERFSGALFLPGPSLSVGYGIGTSHRFIDRWLLHLPKKSGGFVGRVSFVNRFPTLPAVVRVIGFDEQGQLVPGADRSLQVIGVRGEFDLYGGEGVLPASLQDRVSHLGINEQGSRYLQASMTYVHEQTESISKMKEINLSSGSSGSAFLLPPTRAGSIDTKWDGMAVLNVRNDNDVRIFLDQRLHSDGSETTLSSRLLGDLCPAGKLLYVIDEGVFPYVDDAYFVIRTEENAPVQVIALHGGPGFLGVNNELTVLK